MKKFLMLTLIWILQNYPANSQAFSIDTTFHLNYNFYAMASGASVNGMCFEPDGKLMIFGDFNDGYINPVDIIRVYNNGSLDMTWHFIWEIGVTFLHRLGSIYIIEGMAIFSKIDYFGQTGDTIWNNNISESQTCLHFFHPHIYRDGSILVGADSTCNIISNRKRCLERFLPDGNLDTNFRHSTNWPVHEIVPYKNDKLLLCGGGTPSFTLYDTIPAKVMCRIDTLGNFDTSFKSIFTGGLPRPLFVQNDGKIIMGGILYIQNCTVSTNFVRINPDGSLDSTFNNFNSVSNNNTISTVCPTTDNGFLIGGGFTNYQGYTRNNIAKIDANGYLDTNYCKGLGIDSVFHHGGYPGVSSIVRDSNDRYYVMGYFTYYNGQHVNPIIRLNGLTVGMNETEKTNYSLHLFPNPTSSEVSFTINKPLKDANITLYDISGKKVKEIPKVAINNSYKIPLTGLSPGLYTISIKAKDGTAMYGKLVICR